MTRQQERALRDARGVYIGVLAFDLGDGRVLLSGVRWTDSWIPVMFTVSLGGTRESVTDDLNLSHYLEDIRTGRYPRISA